MSERHDRRRDGYASLLLDLHPVRAGTARLPPGLHGTCQMDRTASDKQALGQRRLTRIRMRDDSKRPALGMRYRHIGLVRIRYVKRAPMQTALGRLRPIDQVAG